MSRKLSYKFIKEQFEKEKYELLSEEYRNNSQKLEYICPNNHKHYITYANWCSGHRCPYCDGQGKPSIQFIKNEFNKEGYKLITDVYTNCYSQLDYICNKEHKHHISWNSWQQGHRCPYCNKRTPIDIDFIKNSFENEKYILLTNKYINADQRLDYICPKGHIGNISWRNWYYIGNRCPLCYYLSISGKNHYNWKGGISFEPYSPEFNNKLKKSILERDNYKCQNPDCWGTGSKLTGHHIDYNKKNCDPSNIITICDSCNTRANFNREHWKKFYKKIMKEKILIKEVFNYVSDNSLGKI